MRVSVFGLGYVGSVTATALARSGHEVTGVDVNADKVAMVNRGTPPLVEPGLEEAMREAIAQRRLCATTSTEEAIAKSDVAMVCVGTPSRSNGQLDVSAVERVGDRQQPHGGAAIRLVARQAARRLGGTILADGERGHGRPPVPIPPQAHRHR